MPCRLPVETCCVLRLRETPNTLWTCGTSFCSWEAVDWQLCVKLAGWVLEKWLILRSFFSSPQWYPSLFLMFFLPDILFFLVQCPLLTCIHSPSCGITEYSHIRIATPKIWHKHFYCVCGSCLPYLHPSIVNRLSVVRSWGKQLQQYLLYGIETFDIYSFSRIFIPQQHKK